MTNESTNPEDAKKSNNDSSQPGHTEYPGDAYGFDLYPQRRGGTVKRTWWKVLIGLEGEETYSRLRCEKHVYECAQTSPIVKLMMGALKSVGCPFDLQRHVTCEICSESVTGGYDTTTNQIVVCQNMAITKGVVQGVMAHEMVHMFDYCSNELDFKNLDHLACTEIRAANFGHCSFTGAWLDGHASLTVVKGEHKKCVKDKALASVLAVRKVPPEEAEAAVDRVFTRCYNDLEPVGRRIRRNSMDMDKAYEEGRLYGYQL